MELWFYHLERTPLDQVLPGLLEKSLARNWRVLISSPDHERIKWLDEWLWTWREDSFLPHGTADTPRAHLQPVLLSADVHNENDAKIAILLDGADPDKFEGYERVILIFDGADEAAVQQARGLWKRSKAKGQTVLYWKQNESGVWKNMA